MAKLKVNSYETYEDFVKLAFQELDKTNHGDIDISIKPLDFRDCIFGMFKFLIEEALKGNKPNEEFSLSQVELAGRQLCENLHSLYSSKEETNNRNKLINASRFYHLSNKLDTQLSDVINLCNLILSYPQENRDMLAKVLKKSHYISYSIFGSQDMYTVVRHFLDKCTEYTPQAQRYLLTPQYIISDMLKTGFDLKHLASVVEPLTSLKLIEYKYSNSLFSDSPFSADRGIELPYEHYYNIVVSLISHRLALDVALVDTDDKSVRALTEIRNLSKLKQPFTTIYTFEDLPLIIEEALGIKGVGKIDELNSLKFKLSDLYLDRYGDDVKCSIYDYYTNTDRTKEVCSITTISILETHVYRRASKEDYQNYIEPLTNYLCIKEVTVEEEFRGTGLLRQMLDSLKEEARKEGITKIVLQPYPIKSKNKAAKPMEILQKDLIQKYSHLGFKIVVEGEVHDGVQFMLMELSLENEVSKPKVTKSSIFS